MDTIFQWAILFAISELISIEKEYGKSEVRMRNEQYNVLKWMNE